MKLTKSTLKRLIKEELTKTLNEGWFGDIANTIYDLTAPEDVPAALLTLAPSGLNVEMSKPTPHLRLYRFARSLPVSIIDDIVSSGD